MDDDPKYDPIIQIEKVLEETRRNVDETTLPCKSTLLTNAFYQIKEQLDNYINEAQEKLKIELSDTDLKYWTFALNYYQKQLDFVNVDITIMEANATDLQKRIDSHLITVQDKEKRFATVGQDIPGYGQQYNLHKSRRDHLWTNILNVVGRKEERISKLDGPATS